MAFTPRKPDYHVVTQRDQNAPNVKIGAAWKHEDGEGIKIRLDALPLNGSITLFPPIEENEDSEQTHQVSETQAS